MVTLLRNRRGAGTLGCLVSLLIFAAVLYYGYHVGQVYWKFYQLQDAMKSQARLAPSAVQSGRINSWRAPAIICRRASLRRAAMSSRNWATGLRCSISARRKPPPLRSEAPPRPAACRSSWSGRTARKCANSTRPRLCWSGPINLSPGIRTVMWQTPPASSAAWSAATPDNVVKQEQAEGRQGNTRNRL